ncbi:MAG TPA: VIT domain-containing protein [bacterium]|nr:VIT domain-containing protein [bacterium]
MKKKRISILLAIQLLLPAGVFADGMIIIDPPPEPDIWHFPLEVEYHHVDIQITDNIAETEVDQVFYNPSEINLEGTYLFPIPDNAAISEFSMFVGGEELKGEVKDAEEARRIYEEYVRNLIDPALLEYVGQDLFQARVYPIEAGSEKRITLGYSEELTFSNGIYQYVYPLNTEKFSASEIGEVTVDVKITASRPIKSIYSPSHAITISREGNMNATVSYREENTLPATDFVLYYTVSDEPFGADVMTFDEDGQKYFMLLLAPDYQPADQQAIEKDIVFIIDQSGSMAGEKLEQAKGALDFALTHLNPGDRFNIVIFTDGVSVYKQGELIGASATAIQEARAYVQTITDQGGTNIYDALETGLDLLDTSARPQMVIFLTDGLPTVGNTDIDGILANTTAKNTMGARLFTFGVGYDVNTNLLDKLSNQNNAISEYVLPEENIETKVSGFYSKIANPILSDLELVIDATVKASAMYPQELPDLFQGSQVVLIGKYEKDDTAGVVLSGNVGSERKSFAYRLAFDSDGSRNYFIPRLWATRRIGQLLDEIRLNGESDELVDEIIRLSKQYGIITQYTSFLVDMDITQDETQLLKESRSYWDESKVAYEFDSQTGSSAVNNAQGTQNMFQQLNAAAPKEIAADAETTERIAQRNDKTFYLQDSFWIDDDFAEEDVVAIKQYSDAYFDLLAADSELGDYLSLGGNVALNFAGKNYRISESGESQIDAGDLPDVREDDEKLGGLLDGTAYMLIVFGGIGVLVAIWFFLRRGAKGTDKPVA